MAKKPEKLLQEARKAYKAGDKRKGAALVNEILQQDFNHRATWEFLQTKYGRGRPIDVFQQDFVQQYYPERSEELKPIQPAPEGVLDDRAMLEKTRKPSLLQRLLNLFRRKPTKSHEDKEVEQETAAPPSPAAAESDLAPSMPGASAQTPPSAMPVVPAFKAPEADAFLRPVDDSNKIKVVVVDDIEETLENVIRSLSFEERIEVIGTANDGRKGIELVKRLYPDVVIMDVNMPDLDGITAAEMIHQVVPAVHIIILTVQDDIDYMRRAMQAGARDFMSKPPVIDELLDAVRRGGKMARVEKSKHPVPVTVQTQASKTTAGADSRQPVRPPGQGAILTVYSPKGGTGSTFIATNLAIALHSEATPAILVDGNLQFGDVAIFFRGQPRNTLLDLTNRVNELDPDIVQEVAIKHESGLLLLAAPRPEQAETVTGEQFLGLLKYLRQQYTYVVVDASHHLGDVTFAAFDASDAILVLMTQEIASINAARKFVDVSGLLQVPPTKLMLALNRWDKRLNITPQKVSELFQSPLVGTIPSDPALVLETVNRGTPLLAKKEQLGHPVARSLLDLTKAVTEKVRSKA